MSQTDNTPSEAPTEQTVLGWVSSLSNWGRWGDDDERGTLNLITPAVRRAAAASVTDGLSISCARDIAQTVAPGDTFGPPHRFMLFTGEGLNDEHRVTQRVATQTEANDRVHGASEYVGMAFHGFGLTHLDAPSHIFWDRQMYNGAPPELVTSQYGATRHAVTAASGGIVTRGVLLDVPALKGLDWLEPGTPVFPEDLEAAEERQQVRVGEGDAVLLRTGYGRLIRERGPADPWSDGQAGWHAACLPWLRERGVALIGCDTSNDVMPSGYPELLLPIHVVGIVAMGLWLADNLDLEEAASTCAQLARWSFMFALAPLRVVGATGSPANPLAVF